MKSTQSWLKVCRSEGCDYNSSSSGLDFALLEQQKAKLYESQDVDDEMALEQVFQELSAPKKPTREELVANLKKSRSKVSPL